MYERGGMVRPRLGSDRPLGRHARRTVDQHQCGESIQERPAGARLREDGEQCAADPAMTSKHDRAITVGAHGPEVAI
jgi:hypothetical protein